MKHLLYTITLLSLISVKAQEMPDAAIEALRSQYNESPNVQCDILIQVDVSGMTVPDKEVFVEFRGDEKPRVKARGLSLLPKKGTLDQFRKMLNSPMQAIFLYEKGQNLVYKLVAMDEKSDWVTADIVFDKDRYLIYESVVNTRKFGTFSSEHSYTDQIYPSKSVISFDVKKFKLPLKFIGSEHTSASDPEKNEQVKGKITLTYTYHNL